MTNQETFDKLVASIIVDFGKDKELKLPTKVFEAMPTPQYEVTKDEEFITIKLLN